MKLWNLSDPWSSPFAWASAHGTYEGEEDLCPGCDRSQRTRARPLVMEWEPGSDQIGDFTWTTYTFFTAVRQDVLDCLAARFRGFQSGPVEMFQDPRLKRPQRPNRRTKPRVWLPYDGPPLSELWLTARVRWDRERTTARLKERCETCGTESYELSGVATMRKPREPGRGIFVHRKALGSADFFEIEEWLGWKFCTDEAKQFIEEKGFTNVSFLEAGDILA